MIFIEQTLAACPLFAPLAPKLREEIRAQIRWTARSYQRDEVVAFEDDPCEALGIVASGSIHIQRIFPSGKLITIETFSTGDSFGEALVFAGTGTYPATLIAKEDTSVVYIARASIVELCSRHPDFLVNFLRTLSDRILLLNRKIKNLSFGSVRQKVANFILEEQNRQKADRLALTATRRELADALGIPRPSLSRELIALQAEGWITFDRRTIQVNNRAALEKALLA